MFGTGMWAAAAVAAGALAVVDADRHEVLFVGLDGRVAASAPTGVGPRAAAVREGALFVADRGTERAPGSSVSVIDLGTRTARRTIAVCDGCGPAALAFAPDGTLWIAAQAQPALLALSPPYERVRATPLDDAPASVVAAGFGAAAGLAGRDVATLERPGATPRRAGIAGAPEVLAARPGGSEVFTAAGAEGALVALDLAAARPARRLPAPAFVQDLAFARADTLLVACGRDRILVALDPETGRERARVGFASAPRRIAVAADGARAAVTLPEEGRVALVAIGDDALRVTGAFDLDAEAAALVWID